LKLELNIVRAFVLNPEGPFDFKNRRIRDLFAAIKKKKRMGQGVKSVIPNSAKNGKLAGIKSGFMASNDPKVVASWARCIQLDHQRV